MQAFEAFKDANDERLGADREAHDRRRGDERQGRAHQPGARRDQGEADELTLKARRPRLSGDDEAHGAAASTSSAFEAYVRKGETQASSTLEAKAMSVTSNPDGGYLVPAETEAEIGRMLARCLADPRHRRCAAGVVATSTRSPSRITGAAVRLGRRNRGAARDGSPTLAELQFPTMELYAMPAATQSLLDDAVVDIDQWIAEGSEDGLCRAGKCRPSSPATAPTSRRGFLDYTKVADATGAGAISAISPPASPAALPASNPSDKLIDLDLCAEGGLSPECALGHEPQDAGGDPQVQGRRRQLSVAAAAAPGASATLMGFPIVEGEDMPDIAADSHAIAFGDFKRGYLIVDRVGVRVLRDPYSAKPYVLFYTTKRVGGGVQDFEAIKLMKFGVS